MAAVTEFEARLVVRADVAVDVAEGSDTGVEFAADTAGPPLFAVAGTLVTGTAEGVMNVVGAAFTAFAENPERAVIPAASA